MVEFKKWFIIISFIVIFGLSVAIVAINGENKNDFAKDPTASQDFAGSVYFSSAAQTDPTLGANPQINKALYVLSTMFNAFIIVFVALEIISRASMSAFMVYPCELQDRQCCCVHYQMPKFWVVTMVLTGASFIIQAALVALLFTNLGLTFQHVDMAKVIPLVGAALIQLVLSIINYKISVRDLTREMSDDVDMEAGKSGGSGHGLEGTGSPVVGHPAP